MSDWKTKLKEAKELLDKGLLGRCLLHLVLLDAKLLLDPADPSLCLETECVITHV